MSTMNEFLAQHYNTAGATAEIEKTAGELSDDDKVLMFAKVAKDNNIDLLAQTDEKLDQLFAATFGAKEAGAMPPQFAKKDEDEEKKKKDDEEKEKKAAAEAEFNEKRAAQQKFEEADFLGRTMAHAYVNEMRKIAASVTPAAPPAATDKTASAPTAPTESLRDRLLKLAEFPPKKDEKDEKKDKDDKGGKSAPPWMKDKEASALNDLAAHRALEMVAAYRTDDGRQFDVKVAAERIAAAHTLGIPDDVKIASAADADTATTIRALEYLEAAGYPVNWGG